MTISSPDTISTTIVQDGQAAGSITPADARIWVDSAGGIAAATKTVTYTAALVDRGTCIEMNNAGATIFQIPTNASVVFDIGTVIEVYRMGAGTVTIAAVTPGTTTLRPGGTLTLRAQYSTASVRKRATDEWVVSGDLT